MHAKGFHFVAVVEKKFTACVNDISCPTLHYTREIHTQLTYVARYRYRSDVSYRTKIIINTSTTYGIESACLVISLFRHTSGYVPAHITGGILVSTDTCSIHVVCTIIRCDPLVSCRICMLYEVP